MTRSKRSISVKAATSHVFKNLARYRRKALRPEWEGWDLDSLEEFAPAVKKWLADKSNLSTATLDAADYGEILADFREMADWAPPARYAVFKIGVRQFAVRDLTTRLDAAVKTTHSSAQRIVDGLNDGTYRVDSLGRLQLSVPSHRSKSGVLARNTDGLSLAEETSAAPPAKIRIVALNDAMGNLHVHKAGCADIARERARAAVAWEFDAATLQEAAEEVFGDVIDQHDAGSGEWKNACLEEAVMTNAFKPCVRFPGEEVAKAAIPESRRKPAAAKADKPKRVTVPVEPVQAASARREVPENWVYMSKNADTEHARAWWAAYCERYAAEAV